MRGDRRAAARAAGRRRRIALDDRRRASRTSASRSGADAPLQGRTMPARGHPRGDCVDARASCTVLRGADGAGHGPVADRRAPARSSLRRSSTTARRAASLGVRSAARRRVRRERHRDGASARAVGGDRAAERGRSSSGSPRASASTASCTRRPPTRRSSPTSTGRFSTRTRPRPHSSGTRSTSCAAMNIARRSSIRRRACRAPPLQLGAERAARASLRAAVPRARTAPRSTSSIRAACSTTGASTPRCATSPSGSGTRSACARASAGCTRSSQTQQEISALELDPRGSHRSASWSARSGSRAPTAPPVQWFEGSDSVFRARVRASPHSSVGLRLDRARASPALAALHRRGRLLGRHARPTRASTRTRCSMLGARSLICAPLYRDGRVEGVLVGHAAEPDAFDELAVETTRLMAEFVSTVMRNAAELETPKRARRRAAHAGPGRRAHADRRCGSGRPTRRRRSGSSTRTPRARARDRARRRRDRRPDAGRGAARPPGRARRAIFAQVRATASGRRRRRDRVRRRAHRARASSRSRRFRSPAAGSRSRSRTSPRRSRARARAAGERGAFPRRVPLRVGRHGADRARRKLRAGERAPRRRCSATRSTS